MKDRVIAMVLAIFLGNFGIHKFYLRKNTQGVLYLVFCWTIIPGILGIIDFVILLFMSDREFNQKYN